MQWSKDEDHYYCLTSLSESSETMLLLETDILIKNKKSPSLLVVIWRYFSSIAQLYISIIHFQNRFEFHNQSNILGRSSMPKILFFKYRKSSNNITLTWYKYSKFSYNDCGTKLSYVIRASVEFQMWNFMLHKIE